MKRRGSVLIETAMYAPLLLVLLVGMVELARLGFTYYTLQKTMYTLARYVGTQQGVNFCNADDPTVLAAKNLALTGSLDGSAPAIVQGLTAEQVSVQIERYDAAGETLGACDCSPGGCDAGAGGLPPDFVVVDLPNGFQVRPVFFGFSVDPFQLRPRVRVPYGGT
jgi:hypothetical protein